MLVDYNVRRVACSAVKSITASTTATAMCLPPVIFISYANTDPMEPVIIHQETKMVTASVLLIHYSSAWTGQAARGSTCSTYAVGLIPLFISLTLSRERREKSDVHLDVAV